MDSANLEIALIVAGSTLAGALIGALSPLIVGVFAARTESRRARSRLAVELALADDKAIQEGAAALVRRKGAAVAMPPIAITFLYHLRLLELADENGRVHPDDLLKLRAEAREYMKALKRDPSVDYDSI
jgi:hypothetical protein